jgi:hypothetical protein
MDSGDDETVYVDDESGFMWCEEWEIVCFEGDCAEENDIPMIWEREMGRGRDVRIFLAKNRIREEILPSYIGDFLED